MNDAATVTTDTDETTTETTVTDKSLPAGYIRNADGSITAPLAYPAADGPQSVVLKRLNGQAMLNVMNAKGDGDRVKRMVLGSLGMVGPKGDAFFNALDGWDMVLLGEACASFLPNGRTTGQ